MGFYTYLEGLNGHYVISDPGQEILSGQAVAQLLNEHAALVAVSSLNSVRKRSPEFRVHTDLHQKHCQGDCKSNA
jgi:hypothetical protein